MIEIPELLVVLVAFSLSGGYIAIVHHILTHADGIGKAEVTGQCLHK